MGTYFVVVARAREVKTSQDPGRYMLYSTGESACTMYLNVRAAAVPAYLSLSIVCLVALS